MIIFGGPGTGSGSRGPRTLLGPEEAAIVEASRYNQDISFAFGAQPRLREAEKGLLESLGQSAAPDGRGRQGLRTSPPAPATSPRSAATG